MNAIGIKNNEKQVSFFSFFINNQYTSVVSTLFPCVQCPVSPPYLMSGPGSWPLMLPSSDAAPPLVGSSGTGDTGDTGLRAVIGQDPGDNLSLVETVEPVTPGEMGREFAARISDNVYTSLGPICCHHNSFVVNPRWRGTVSRSELGQLLSSFLAPELAGHSRLSLSPFVSSSRYPPCLSRQQLVRGGGTIKTESIMRTRSLHRRTVSVSDSQ